MSRFRRFQIFQEEEPFFYHCHTSPLFFTQTTTASSIAVPKTLAFPSFIEETLHLDLGFDLVPVDPTPSFLHRRIQQQQLRTEFCLQSLSDRVAELESRIVGGGKGGDRKYTWTAEIKGAEKDGFDRKYKWIAELVEKEKKKKKNIKWTAEIKGKGVESGNNKKYTFQVESGDDDATEKIKKKKNKSVKKETEKGSSRLRIVEIEEPTSVHRDVVLRQAFAKRFGAVQNGRGKKKELSPQDAALLIQISFKSYLIRRSKALRALRELAVAKSKLKEIRAQFNNFSYRRRIARDAEECQRFSEKVIVLLLTIDAIEGADLMVRSAKKSMVDELEAMLDVVDPQPDGKSLSFKRRTFDMPDGVIRKEIEEGVAQVVRMLDEAENSSSTFEA
ncbi:hypothetical protein RIF29_32784 [Crotalaria pallida]|uniref:BAG domain-containing protein n=1 Tax=Crotalaria pallida TaxID=3830 RepID=A0AAN9EQP8_CROPI